MSGTRLAYGPRGIVYHPMPGATQCPDLGRRQTPSVPYALPHIPTRSLLCCYAAPSVLLPTVRCYGLVAYRPRVCPVRAERIVLWVSTPPRLPRYPMPYPISGTRLAYGPKP
eukprot:3281104-Rhodomonas_salina.4